SQISTLAAATQNISRLQAEIAQKQAQIKQLDDQRTALLKQADQFARQSEKQTGQASVDSYNKASDLRKQAADLATQMETIKAQMVPLQMDLAVAQGQQAIVTQAIAEFKQQTQLLDEHWKAVQGQIAAQQEVARQITAPAAGGATTQPADPQDVAAAKSITEKATALANLIAQTN